jgi:hypothetical protein
LGDYSPTVGVEALDYWLRIGALFPLERLDGEEPLHRRRVVVESPGARAHPGALGERLERLRTDEPIRQRYFSRGWQVFVDDVTDVRLAGLPLAPHVTEIVDLAAGIPSRGEEFLLLIHPSSLQQVAARPLPPECVVVVWFDVDDPTPYRHGAELQRLVHACLVADTATAERCAIFTRRVLHATTPRDALALATAFASSDVWALKTIPGADRERSVPEVLLPPESPLRVLVEVSGFEEGGLERVVLDLAAVLRTEGVEVTIAVLGWMGRAA